MQVSINWIKDFVDLPELSPQELASQFTLGCAEVEEVSVLKQWLEHICIVQVESIKPHPQADKLRLVTFSGFTKGQGKSTDKSTNKSAKEVVCGAPNVKVGAKYPYAPVGVTLPGGLTLMAKKIRGVLSEGMLCSAAELELGEEAQGIWQLPSSAVVGQSLLTHLGQKKDVILHIDNKSLTHRPDLWGHLGLAREFAAIANRPLAHPYDQAWEKEMLKRVGSTASASTSESGPIQLQVEPSSCALAYLGLSIDQVEVKDSPSWLTERLQAIGQRPINNMVDIGNYVMQELGMPLHIFDRQLIAQSKVVVRTARKGETLVTLDGQKRILASEDTVVADGERPLVLAGIMGGQDSGVTTQTHQIFIEVANWQATSVRRTSTRLGLRSDSSQRYEKGLDSTHLQRVLLRATQLVLELCPGARVQGDICRAGAELTPRPPLSIQTSVGKINQVLGLALDRKRISSLLQSLEFSVSPAGATAGVPVGTADAPEDLETIKVAVPSFRRPQDIQEEVDIIEEIGRLVGYDQIRPAPLSMISAPVRLTPAQKLARNIRHFLSLHGQAFEVMTYPLVGPELLAQTHWPTPAPLTLHNPLSADASQMRTSLIPKLLQAVALNSKNFDQFRLFELGRTYHPNPDPANPTNSGPFACENQEVALAFFHREHSPYLELLNTLERLWTFLSIPAQLSDPNPRFPSPKVPPTWPGLSPFEQQNILTMGKVQGTAFSLHPQLAKSLKIKGHLTLAIMDITAFQQRNLESKLRYHPIERHPPSHFDWTVVAESDRTAASILSLLRPSKVKIAELISVKVVGVFPLAEGQKSITLRARFQGRDKTLDRNFLKQAQGRLVELTTKNSLPLKS